jgi:RecA-family ATPase
MLDLKETASPIDKGEIIRPFPILDSMLKPRPWVVKNFVMAECGNALFAGPGEGKSLLELSVAAAVAAGDSHFGQLEIKRNGPVLVINREEALGEIYHRAWAVMKHRGELDRDIPLHLYERPNIRLLERDRSSGKFRGTDFREQLIAQIKEGGYVMVVIDPMIELIDGLDENASVDMNRLAEELAIIGRETGAGILAVHHSRKGNSRGAESMRGSSALHGRFRVVTQLNRLSAEDDIGVPQDKRHLYRTTLNSKQNYGPDGEQWFYKLHLYDHKPSGEVNATLMPTVVKTAVDDDKLVAFLHGQRYYKKPDKKQGVVSSARMLHVEFDIDEVAAARHISRLLETGQVRLIKRTDKVAKRPTDHFEAVLMTAGGTAGNYG